MLRRLWRTAIVVVPLFSVTNQAAAQNAVTCGWHYLQDTQTPSVLDAIVRATPGRPVEREAVDLFLQWYRACDATAARKAEQLLRSEQRQHNSTDPQLTALWAITLTRGPDVQVPRAEGVHLRPAHRLSNAERQGVRLLERALLRTGQPELAEEIVSLALQTRGSTTVRIALRTLRTAVERHADVRLLVPLAEIELAAGNTQRAAAAARAAGDGLNAPPRALRILGLAAMLSDNNPEDGARIYINGLKRAVAATDIQVYFDDIRLILSRNEQAAAQSVERITGDWILKRWEWRAHAAGMSVGARLLLNYERLAYATTHFLRQSYRGATPATALWPHDSDHWLQPFDDRGMLYLRHGPPDRELRMTPSVPTKLRPGLDTTHIAFRIAWFYQLAGVDRSTFEFDKSHDRADYFLADPHPICDGIHVLDGVGRRGFPTMVDPALWASTLAPYEPGLAAYYGACGAASGEASALASTWYESARGEAHVAATAAFETENTRRGSAISLSAVANLYTFRGTTGTELVGYISVGGDGLAYGLEGSAVLYRLNVRLSAASMDSDRFFHADTAIAFARAQPLAPNSAIHAAVTLPIAVMGESHINISVQNHYRQQQAQVLAGKRSIAEQRDASWGLSDLVVAERRIGTLRRGPYALAPAPGHAIGVGAPFRLYYELYGAAVGDRLEVAILLAPGDDRGSPGQLDALMKVRQAVQLKYAEPALPGSDGVLRSDRELTLNIRPGTYQLQVTVRNPQTGQVATQGTRVVVLREP